MSLEQIHHARLQFGDADGVPVLLAWPVGAGRPGQRGGAPPWGAVVLQHGFQQEKESRLEEMLPIAEAGLLAVSPDAPAHGDRWDMERLAAANRDFPSVLTSLIIEAGQDIVRVMAWLEREFGLGRERIGLLGSSMGGSAVLVATPLAHPAATVATKPPVDLRYGWGDRAEPGGGLEPTHPSGQSSPLSPEVAALAEQFDPPARVAAFPPTALLLIAGEQDPLIPIASVQGFHQALGPHYAAMPERLRLELYQGGHSTPPHLKDASRAWLLKYLRNGY